MRSLTFRKWVFWGASALIFIIFGYAVFEKEQILAKGDTVFLKLRPADPRSLMQGDYMTLRYDVNQPQTLDRGFFVIEAHPVSKEAHVVRIHDDTDLADNEYLLRYSNANWRERIRPNSFFFQEGHAQAYDRAAYGVFRCVPRGTCLLVGLADDKRLLIDPKKGKEKKQEEREEE